MRKHTRIQFVNFDVCASHSIWPIVVVPHKRVEGPELHPAHNSSVVSPPKPQMSAPTRGTPKRLNFSTAEWEMCTMLTQSGVAMVLQSGVFRDESRPSSECLP